MSFDLPLELVDRFRRCQRALVAQSLAATRMKNPMVYTGWVLGFERKEERDTAKAQLEAEYDRMAFRNTVH